MASGFSDLIKSFYGPFLLHDGLDSIVSFIPWVEVELVPVVVISLFIPT